MNHKITLSVIVKQEAEGGYSVLCPELDVSSQGETFEEAISNIKEAVELYIESAEEIGMKDEVFEKLGITKEELKKEVIFPKIVTANVPVEVSI